MLAAQGGANLIYGAGMIELGVTFDFAQLVMDNEIFKMVKRVIKGIPVTDELLAIDVIKQVGPGGEFISHEHTYKNFKSEQSNTKLIDRRGRDAWLLDGGKNMTDRAYEDAQYILNNYKPEKLPEAAALRIREIIAETEIEYGVVK